MYSGSNVGVAIPDRESGSAESSSEDPESDEADLHDLNPEHKPPVKAMLFAFMFMFQGYGVMVGGPQHLLKKELVQLMNTTELPADFSAKFQDATASFQLAKMVMRILQIALLPFLPPNGIVYLAYVIMFAAVCTPVVFVWGAGISDLWVVYLQYMLGGVAIGLFEGTFLAVISTLGKNTKTFAIMGAPLGFAVNNILLETIHQLFGMPAICFYICCACVIPIAVWIFHKHAPAVNKNDKGKGCGVFCNSLKKPLEWVPLMIPWFIAKFIGNFVLEDGFPLLFNTFNTEKVPLWGGAASIENLVPFAYYTAWFWFPMMAIGDTISRRVPQYLTLGKKRYNLLYLFFAAVLCVGGEALYWLLNPIITGFAVFISNFGNGFIYGLSAKFIDAFIPEEHRYTAYNLWCFFGDMGGYVGQSSFSVAIADNVCEGRHYTYVCHSTSASNVTTS
jgi:hypothetical protein